MLNHHNEEVFENAIEHQLNTVYGYGKGDCAANRLSIIRVESRWAYVKLHVLHPRVNCPFRFTETQQRKTKKRSGDRRKVCRLSDILDILSHRILLPTKVAAFLGGADRENFARRPRKTVM